MKLNNKGFGLRHIIIAICVTVCILFFTSIRIRAFIKENRNNNKSNQNNTDNLNKMHSNAYQTLEYQLEKAGESYILYHETLLEYSTDHVIVGFETLKNEGYITSLPDPESNGNCNGYAMIFEDETAKGFIKCKNYETLNYSLWVD